jgi:hypothetical protein
LFECFVHLVRGLLAKALNLRLSLRYGSIHVSYHLRILNVVVAISRYDYFGEVVVVHLFGSVRVSHSCVCLQVKNCFHVAFPCLVIKTVVNVFGLEYILSVSAPRVLSVVLAPYTISMHNFLNLFYKADFRNGGVKWEYLVIHLKCSITASMHP